MVVQREVLLAWGDRLKLPNTRVRRIPQMPWAGDLDSTVIIHRVSSCLLVIGATHRRSSYTKLDTRETWLDYFVILWRIRTEVVLPWATAVVEPVQPACGGVCSPEVLNEN